jgi:NAD+ synthase
MDFGKHVLELDPQAETARITFGLRENVQRALRRQGAVVGISGGVDSAVVMALCVRAFGADKVCALMLPERDSEPESRRLAENVAAQFGVTPVLEDITPALQGLGCYQRRDAAIRRVFPEYRAERGYKARIGLPGNLLDNHALNVTLLTIVRPDGAEISEPLPPAEFRQIVAASNMKQRTRMALLYYHAELRHFAVIGTANKDEHDQGFFVKYGDGGIDAQAIVHLYKTQVYQLAEYLGIPEAIRRRTPTTDTYSASTSQEEFFFRLPFATMDLLWYAQEHNIPVVQVTRATGLTEAQVARAYADLAQKTRAAAYLRKAPLVIQNQPARPAH